MSDEISNLSWGQAIGFRIESLLIYAFSIVAGIAIADLTKETIDAIWPKNKRANLIAKYVYTAILILVFIIVVIVLTAVHKVATNISNKNKAKSFKKKNQQYKNQQKEQHEQNITPKRNQQEELDWTEAVEYRVLN